MEEAVRLEGGVEVSEVLRPGCYALAKGGSVVYVGKSKVPLVRIYTHRNLLGRRRPVAIPIRGISYDQVWVFPCRIEELDSLERELINRYKPRYNTYLKDPTPIPNPLPLSIRRLIEKPLALRRI